jgi:hypothetical protein
MPPPPPLPPDIGHAFGSVSLILQFSVTGSIVQTSKLPESEE